MRKHTHTVYSWQTLHFYCAILFVACQICSGHGIGGGALLVWLMCFTLALYSSSSLGLGGGRTAQSSESSVGRLAQASQHSVSPSPHHRSSTLLRQKAGISVHQNRGQKWIFGFVLCHCSFFQSEKLMALLRKGCLRCSI